MLMKHYGGHPSVDMTGARVGRLTIMYDIPSPPGVHEGRWWHCKCDCGNEIDVPRKRLRHTGRGSKTRSCGCLSKEFSSDRCTHNHPCWKGYGQISGAAWCNIRDGALKRRSRIIPFELSIEEAWALFEKQDRKCALTGLTLTFDSRQRCCDGNASLDRIDSSKGYFLGNVQWVDKRINLMKMALSQQEFIQMCKMVADNSP